MYTLTSLCLKALASGAQPQTMMEPMEELAVVPHPLAEQEMYPSLPITLPPLVLKSCISPLFSTYVYIWDHFREKGQDTDFNLIFYASTHCFLRTENQSICQSWSCSSY